MAWPHHTAELHSERLDSLCRVCGGKSVDKKQPNRITKCSLFAADLEHLHSIRVSDENNGNTFSKRLCNKCRVRFLNYRKRGDPSGAALKKALDLFEKAKEIWTPFDSTCDVSQCSVCSMFKTKNSNKSVSQDVTPIQTAEKTDQCSQNVKRRLFETVTARQAEKRLDDSIPAISSQIHEKVYNPNELVADLWTNSAQSARPKKADMRPIDQLSLPLTRKVSCYLNFKHIYLYIYIYIYIYICFHHSEMVTI